MSAMAQRRMLQLTGMVLDRGRWQRSAGGVRGGGEEDARACRACRSSYFIQQKIHREGSN